MPTGCQPYAGSGPCAVGSNAPPRLALTHHGVAAVPEAGDRRGLRGTWSMDPVPNYGCLLPAPILACPMACACGRHIPHAVSHQRSERPVRRATGRPAAASPGSGPTSPPASPRQPLLQCDDHSRVARKRSSPMEGHPWRPSDCGGRVMVICEFRCVLDLVGTREDRSYVQSSVFFWISAGKISYLA